MTEPVGVPRDELKDIFNVLIELLTAMQRIAAALERLIPPPPGRSETMRR